MSDHAIGIDLGTSTSSVSYFRNNEPCPIPDPSTKSAIIPSLVAFKRNGETVTGEMARALAYSERGVIEVKRKMGSVERVTVLTGESEQRTFRPEEISALILRKIKDIVEGTLNTTIKDAVITVPANFSDAARLATKHAAEIAGLNVLRLINEPTAAALAFGINNLDTEEQMIVFDFGGGTLDITVLEMFEGILDVKCSFGDPCLGGKDIDEALIGLAVKKFQQAYPELTINDRSRLSLKRHCESAKIELSNQQSTQIFIPNFHADSGSPIDFEIEISREEFERSIEPILEKSRICVREALKSKELRPSSIQRILLVGGTTYIPAVRRMVAEVFGKEPSAGVHPDLAVSMGAAIQAALVKGHIDAEKGIILTDVVPFSLGTDMVTQIGYQEVLVFDPLIERNQKIPYTTQKTYILRYIDQEELLIRLYQDRTGRAKFPDECEDTGIEGIITDIPASTNGQPHKIIVDFTYNSDGCAIIKASIPAVGKTIHISYGKSEKRMDEQEVAVAKTNVMDILKKNPKAKNYEAIIEKAERLISCLCLAEQQKLNAVVVELKQALIANNDHHIGEAGDKLVDLLYDLESR